MSSLNVLVNSNGSLPLETGVSVYPVSQFLTNPIQGSLPPAQAAAASGSTGANGEVTLTGLTAQAYWLMVEDAIDYPYWFYVASSWIGSAAYYTVSLTVDSLQRGIK
jgi:hypothetical protein